MSNAKTGRFSGPGEGNVYAKATEVIVKITGADARPSIRPRHASFFAALATRDVLMCGVQHFLKALEH